MKGKKGITPFLATVLLVSIVFIVGLIVTTWLGNITRTTQAQAENKTTEATQCASAGISIEDVFVTSGSAKAIVRNSGQADNLVLVSAFILGTNGTNYAASVLDSDFDKGELQTLNFTGGFTCPSGFSKVIVSTNCGGISAEFTTTPKCF